LGAWPGPRILIYHQVGSGSGRQMDVSVEMFARQLEWLKKNGRIVSLEKALAQADSPEAEKNFVLTFDDGYEDMYRNAFPLLKEGSIPFTLYLTTRPIEEGEPLAPGDRPLSWEQVGEMVETGLVTVGSHTHSHPDLRLLSPPEVEGELATADSLIERRIGVAPAHFAYPKGYWAPQAEEFVRSRYDTAVLGAGQPVTASSDRHRLHRVPVQRSDGFFFFVRKLRRGMRLEEWARSRLKGYRNPSGSRRKAIVRHGLGVTGLFLAAALVATAVFATPAVAKVIPGVVAELDQPAPIEPPEIEEIDPPSWARPFEIFAPLPSWAQAAFLATGAALMFLVVLMTLRWLWNAGGSERTYVPPEELRDGG